MTGETSNFARDSVSYPEFSGYLPDTELYDVWTAYYEDRLGPVFPRAVALPLGGILTEEGAAIFGNHLRAMADRQKEWRFSTHLYSVIRSRLEADVELSGPEVVVAIPRHDLTEEENAVAKESLLGNFMVLYSAERYDFPENYQARLDLDRYTRLLDDGSVELLQQQAIKGPKAGVVTVRRVYGPNHEQYSPDLLALEVIISPNSLVTEEHQQHSSVSDSYNNRSQDKLDQHDDALVERLNGHRPKVYDWGTVR